MWALRALLAAGSIVFLGAGGSPEPSGDATHPPLLKDRSATACVQADVRWNHTGIWLEQTGKYLIKAEGTWWDAGYRHGPGGGDSPTPKMKRFERFRRFQRARPLEKPANWFELICALDSRNSTAFAVGCQRTVDHLQGELTCYANDVWLFYFNNTGAIKMTVKRIG